MKIKFDPRAILKYLWESLSAVIAIILIIAALIVGISTGARWFPASPTTTPAVAQSNATNENATDAKERWYTCSMHPQVRLPDKDAKCPICHMGLIPVTTTANDANEGAALLVMTPAALKLAEIETTTVKREFSVATTRLTGKVDFDETRLATIAAYFPGRLETLFVDYTGVRVHAQDHLAEIYSPDLITAQEELQSSLRAVQNGNASSEMIQSFNRAKLEAARDKLRLWGLSNDQINSIETQAELLERLTIYSPIAGVVIEKLAVEGQYVKTGDPIYRVVDLSHLWVRLDAYESQLPFLRYGQAVEFTSESFPGEIFEGTISFIDPVMTQMRTEFRIGTDNNTRHNIL